MNITYQGKKLSTAAATPAALAAELQIDAAHTIFELNGEIIPPGGDLNVPLADGDEINAFRIVAGG